MRSKMTQTTNVFCLTMLFLSVLFRGPAWAEYDENLIPLHLIASNEQVMSGANRQPANTCSHWDRYLRFDATTPGGQNMLRVLLAAIQSLKTVNIWYEPSPVPGTTHEQENGCTPAKMAILTQVGINP